MDTPGRTFARRMRERRRELALSQGELASRLSELLGAQVGPTAITRIERGERGVRLDEAVFIAQILRVPLAALLTERDPDEAQLAELREQLGRLEQREADAESELDSAVFARSEVEREIELLERRVAARGRDAGGGAGSSG